MRRVRRNPRLGLDWSDFSDLVTAAGGAAANIVKASRGPTVPAPQQGGLVYDQSTGASISPLTLALGATTALFGVMAIAGR